MLIFNRKKYEGMTREEIELHPDYLAVKRSIENMAMKDRIFEPESISLEPEGKSLTVRLPEQSKRFNRKSLITIPAFNEDLEYEKEFLLL